MRKLVAFNNVTLDGYFSATNGDISWANSGEDGEFNAFVADNAKSGGALLLGRVTYDLMASYWPTPLAMKTDPVVAERMNAMQKFVCSRTMESAAWNNTTVVNGALPIEVRRLKQEPGPGMAILGSGSIVTQLAQAGLIDEFQVVVNPVVLGSGRTMFDGISSRLSLKLMKSRTFPSGRVYLCYEPANR